MKKIISFAILSIALLLVECSNKKSNPDKKSEDNNKITTEKLRLPESGEDTLKASFFADTVIYIPLETTKESIVDNIKQAWMNDSVILICCYRAGLLMFRQNGKFVRKIGKWGRGPGEYASIYHFDVIRDTIYISSSGKKSLMRYTFDGVFCDEIQLKYQPLYFSSTNDEKLACYEHNVGKVFIYPKINYNPDSIVVEYGVTKGRYYYGFSDPTMTYLQKTPTGLLFTNYLNDTVWNINSNKKEPAFILDIKDELLPYDKQIEFCDGNMTEWDKMAKSYNLFFLVPYSSFLFIYQKHYKDQGFDAIYLKNTKTGEIKKFNTSCIYDDLISNQKLYPYPFLYSANYLFTYYSGPSKILNILNQNKKNIKGGPSSKWLDQMKTVKKDDNPILAIIKIKKNLNE
jgi:hypothetical protein